MNKKQHTFVTKSGVSVNAIFREGKNDWNTLQSIIVEDEYNLQPLIDKVAGGVALDIGAHIGGFSLLAAAMGMTVHAIECLPENAAIIAESAKLNPFGAGIAVHQLAIAGRAGQTIEAHYNDTSTESGDHHEFVGGTTTGRLGTGRTVKVQTTSLQAIMGKADAPIIKRVHILKIDCEGAEWDTFKNLPNDILGRIDYIVGEVHAVGDLGTRADLIKVLRDKFEDVSSQYVTHGGASDLCTFVFKRKGL